MYIRRSNGGIEIGPTEAAERLVFDAIATVVLSALSGVDIDAKIRVIPEPVGDGWYIIPESALDRP